MGSDLTIRPSALTFKHHVSNHHALCSIYACTLPFSFRYAHLLYPFGSFLLRVTPCMPFSRLSPAVSSPADPPPTFPLHALRPLPLHRPIRNPHPRGRLVLVLVLITKSQRLLFRALVEYMMSSCMLEMVERERVKKTIDREEFRK
jgi:hypothetical protein